MRNGTNGFWMASGLAVAVASCVGGPEPAEHTALLVLDREAREAGVTLVGMQVESPALPIAVSTESPVVLSGTAGTQHLDVADGEVVLVRGADATIERHVVGQDVDPDRLVLEASPEVAAEIAEMLGAAVSNRDEGLVEIEGPGVLQAAAGAPVLTGVIETTLVAPESRAVRGVARPGPAAAARTRPAATAARPTTAQAAAVVTAPVEAAPVVLSPHDAAYADLLPAASCHDAVAGTWVARRHFAGERDWYFFTMKIEHTRGGKLRGEILAHSWTGSASDVNSAQACQVGGEQWVVRMPATGRVRGDRVEFGGTAWEVAEHTCGWVPGPGQYNLDQFSGPLAPAGEAIWNNDDGGRMVAEPFEFRRVSCDTN